MQLQFTPVLLAFGLGLIGMASAQYELGDLQCYVTSAFCEHAATNSGCTGCTYYESEGSIPYCCTVTTDPNAK